MRVKTRAMIWIDGRLIVSEHSRRGCKELSLPGGRVRPRESITDALKREVAEETGLEVVPRQFLCASEIVESVRVHDLELIFLAEVRRVPSLGGLTTVDVIGGDRPSVRPPLLDVIARDHASKWRDTPRWLGNLARSATTAREAGVE
jgi:8-oxo-dGTP diphosphatase